MKTHDKLEIFRKLNGLGTTDIEKAFADQPSDLVEHLIRKYHGLRKDHGFYGNFKFLFQLDSENARLLLSYIGL